MIFSTTVLQQTTIHISLENPYIKNANFNLYNTNKE